MKAIKDVCIIIMVAVGICGVADRALAGNDIEKRVINKTRELIATYHGADNINLAVMSTSGDLDAQVIEGMVVRTIFTSRRFTIVERDSMKPILEELKLQNTGLTDAAIALKIGKFTPAQAVLLVSRDSNNVKLRIISVETGEVLSYIFFTLVDEAIVPVGKKQEPIIDRKNYHSPVIAGLVSVFPVYSGSWNARFTEFGMLLVTAKLASPSPAVYFAYNLSRQKHKVYQKRDKVNKFLTTAYFISGPAAVSQYAQMGLLAVENEKRHVRHARKLYNKWWMYSGFILAGVTTIDIFTSVFYMVWWNKKYAYIYSFNSSNRQGVTFSISLREGQLCKDSSKNYFTDGIDFKLLYRY